jgi:hypothetical protein
MQMRRPIAAAICWTILAEILRRHGAGGDLRVIEMHPGGGMYDLLSIFRVDPKRGRIYHNSALVGTINLANGKLRGVGEDAGEIDIVEAWLKQEDPADVVALAERELGMAPSSSSAVSNRWTFGPRIFASLLGSQMTRREYLDGRMCFIDTSGYGGGIDPRLDAFSAIADTKGNGVPDEREDRAALCWLLLAGPKRDVAGVLRMDGLLSTADEPELVHNLFASYRKNRSLPEVTSLCLELLSL